MERLFLFIAQEWILVASFFGLLTCYFLYTSSFKAKKKTAQTLVFDINQKSPMLMLDIRDTMAFHKSHIAEAVNYPAKSYEDLQEKIAHYEDMPIVVIANQQNEAQALADELVNQGIEAYTLEGGMEHWVQAGFPVMK